MAKKDIINYLEDVAEKVNEKSLKDMINYSLMSYAKDPKKVKISDLKALMTDVDSYLVEESKKTKKDTSKTEKKLKKAVKVTPQKKSAKYDIVESFLDEVETELGVLEKADDILNFSDLRKAFEAEEEIYFAVYWSEKYLKQFNYVGTIQNVQQPKSFPHDLDLVSCFYISDEDILAIGTSIMTEMPYVFQASDLEYVDGVRYSNSMEFEVYRLVQEEEE